MRLGDVASYSLQNLRRRPLRTALTVCGVAVGVGTLVMLVSLASGLQRIMSSQFDRAELVTRIVVERKGRARGIRALLDGADDGPEGPPLNDAAIASFREIPGVTASYPEIAPILGLEANERVVPVAGSALPVSALEPTYPPTLLAGRYWEAEDAGNVCVLPSVLLSQLRFRGPEEALGATIYATHFQALARYKREALPQPAPPPGEEAPPPEYRYQRPGDLEVVELSVIGVYDSQRLGILGRMLHVPMEQGLLLQDRFGFNTGQPAGEHLRAVVRVESHESIDSVQSELDRRGFKTETVFDYLQAIEVVFSVFKVLLTFFGMVGLVVAFFGIANTMLMAVLERTREIGVLKALGARDRDVRRVFVIEAGAIGLLGGLVGLGGGWVLGQGFNGIANLMEAFKDSEAIARGFFYVETWLALGVLGLSTLLAAGAGLYPAWRAARLAPVEALRRD